MAEIKEVIDDVKDAVGDKGFLYIILGLGAVFMISFISQSSKDSEESTGGAVMTSYSSYPDTVTNANVIIDSLQNSIDYSEKQIRSDIKDLSDQTGDSFEATNDYINKGFESSKELAEKIGTDLAGDIHDSTNSIIKNDNKLSNEIKGTIATTAKKTDNLVNERSDQLLHDFNHKTDRITDQIDRTNTSIRDLNNESERRFKQIEYTGTSLTDALKSIGEKSDYAYRKQLAKENGIKNYVASPSQNMILLAHLKNGTLKRV